MIQPAVYSGTGNTFVIIDHRSEVELPSKEVIASLCLHEHVDGLLLLKTSLEGDFAMRYFNRDGSEATMCGNGIRCLFRFILDNLGWEKEYCIVAANNRLYTLQKHHNVISVCLGKVIIKEKKIFFPEKKTHGHLVDSGVPHLVIPVDDVGNIAIEEEAPYYRHHPHFAPNGVNVNFIDKNQAIRTFERGVEGETLSCGTGVTATAFALHTLYQIPFPMQFRVRSQEFLTVAATTKGLLLIGDAHYVRACK